MKTKFFFLNLVFLFFNLINAQNTWVQKASVVGGTRHNGVSGEINNKGYVGLGYNSVTATNRIDFWEYDATTNNWAQKANFPGASRNFAASFVVGGKFYVCTGTSNFNPGTTTSYNDLWEYNPTTNTWAQKASFPGGARYGATGFSANGKGYVTMGIDNGSFLKKDLWEYNPSTNSWSQKLDYPGLARYFATSFSIYGTPYVGCGGYNDFYKYNATTNTWTAIPNFPGSFNSKNSSFNIGGNGYVGIGLSGTTRTKGCYKYSASTNTWSTILNFSGSARDVACSFSINNKGYIGMGFDGNSLNDLWEYTPSNFIDIISVTTTTICSGSLLNIPYMAYGVYNLGNVFTAELSNANGSFTSAVSIGSLTSQSSGTINAIIPIGTINGTGYRVRVLSSNVSAVGTDNGNNISINQSPVISSATSSTICSGAGLNFSLTANTPSSFSWLAASNTSVTGESTTPQTANNITNTLVITTNNSQNVVYSITPTSSSNSCVGPLKTLTVTVNPLPNLMATVVSSLICLGETATLNVSGASTYTWFPGNINGATITATPTITTTYTVVGTNTYGCTKSITKPIAVNLCTNIKDNNSLNALVAIYPNPSNGFLKIETNKTELNLLIINNFGQCVKEIKINALNNYSVYLTELNPGIYFLVSPNNKEFINQKIIINN
jgi:N-acetylneuraminic acid mutarotase